MQIALIRPPKLMVRSAVTMKPVPPLGMAYIAAAMEGPGRKVTAIDCIVEGLDNFWLPQLAPDLIVQGLTFQEIVARIPANSKIIAFSCMFSNNWELDSRLINYVAARFPEALIVAGGESITSLATYVLEHSAVQVCVLGEGDATIAELVDCIEKGLDWSKLKGISYRNENGTPVTNARKERIREIDDLPMPAWHLFPTNLYFKHHFTWLPTTKRTLPLLATRGCPYTCTFCSNPQMWTTKYTMRKPAKILHEMQVLYDTYGVTNFELFDLTAIINKAWILEFCSILQKHPVKFTWQMPAGTRSEALSDEVIKAMAAGGCTSITFAPESGSSELLALVKKKANPLAMLPAMKTASNANLYVTMNFILGLPGETHGAVMKTLLYISRAAVSGAHDLTFAMFMPYPGTQLYEDLKAQNVITPGPEYFREMLQGDTFWEFRTYNRNISKASYLLYNILFLICFYGLSFTIHPIRLFRLIKNLYSNTCTTRLENTLGYALKRITMKKQMIKEVSYA